MDSSAPPSPKSPSPDEIPSPSLPGINLPPPPPEPDFENKENPHPQGPHFQNKENEVAYENSPSPVSANFGLDDDDAFSSLYDSGDRYGMRCGIGRRSKMEDAMMVMPRFVGDLDFYAVYDGHGGDGVSNLCKERMHVVLAELVTAPDWDGDWTRALKSCFAIVDKEAVFNPDLRLVGSTAVVAIVGRELIIVSNCGDSRAVLSRDGVAISLTVDQKPDRPDEKARIEAAGGLILPIYGPRVLGILNISRSIGDRYLKPYVISEPEIQVINRTKGDEFLILATDGLWNSVSNDEACDVARNCFTPRSSSLPSASCATEAAELLVDLAYSKECEDNVSVIAINLRNTAFIVKN